MNDPLYQRLRETGWRRPLTPAEEAELKAWLAGHPEAAADWQDEAPLNRILGQLPDAPVPSNFTARVLQAVQREAPKLRRTTDWSWLWRPLAPKAALAAAAFVFGISLSMFNGPPARNHDQLAQSLATVADVASLPSPEILENFDAIQRMNNAPAPDKELEEVLPWLATGN